VNPFIVFENQLKVCWLKQLTKTSPSTVCS